MKTIAGAHIVPIRKAEVFECFSLLTRFWTVSENSMLAGAVVCVDAEIDDFNCESIL